MYKILIIDRCGFSRLGLESWLTQGHGSSVFLVTGLSSLLLAKTYIENWLPHLVIADVSAFRRDTQQAHLIDPLIATAGARSRLMLLEEGEVREPGCTTCSKSQSLDALGVAITSALYRAPSIPPVRVAAPLLTRQEEKVLSLWMEGASNQRIAGEMNIHGKTVYTYKRNIRLKLRVENRFTPFIHLPGQTA